MNRFLLRLTQIIFFALCLVLPCRANLQADTPDWWHSKNVTATGYGLAPSGFDTPRQAQLFARRAAQADCYRKLAAKARDIHISADITVGLQIDAGNIPLGKVNALIRDAEIISEQYDAFGNCTVVMSVPVFGVDNSLASLTFQSVDKQDFPAPTVNQAAQGNYTGLIIDCSDFDLKPVLAPAIRNADNLAVYSYQYLDRDKVISSGVVDYAIKKSPALIGTKALLLDSADAQIDVTRAGDNPLIIKAQALSDDGTCPVVSADDADKILAENQASNFLDNGAVVFTSYRVGGLRA